MSLFDIYKAKKLGINTESMFAALAGRSIVDITERNVWDGEKEQGYIYPDTGKPAASTSTYRTKNFVPLLPSTKYKYSNSDAASGIRLVFYDENQDHAGAVVNASANPQIFTTPSNARFCKFYWDTIDNAKITIVL